jgi:hypothetical protein
VKRFGISAHSLKIKTVTHTKEEYMWNIIIGIIFIIGGLSGQLVLIGTDSGLALAGVGVLLVLWGIYSMAKRRKA